MTTDVMPGLEKNELHEVSRLYREYLNPDLARLIKFSGLGTLEEQAEGMKVSDHTGRTFLDFCGGYGVLSLGHRHPRVVEAVRRQLDKLPLSPRVFLSRHQAYLAQKLAEISPGALRYSFFCNSGTEAVEGALKLARAATGRPGLVAAVNSFHGKTMGSLSVSGRQSYRQPFEPLLGEVRHVAFGDLAAARQAVDETTAAVILEPVQGEGGIHVPPDEYLPGVADLCRERGCLFIADEVQTGLGRTGATFAVEHWGVEPDILALAKALGGGVMPIGAYIATPQVFKAYKGKPLLHTSTFGGNPLACVAALETLAVLRDEGLVERAGTIGKQLLEGLRQLGREYPDLVADVRGLGLLAGLEVTDDGYGGSIISEMAQRGIIAVYTLNQPRVIRFEPPLTVETEDLETMFAALGGALETTRKRFRSDL